MIDRRVTVVTGGARRVGASIVRACARAGDAIVLHHGHSPQEALALADTLRADGTPVEVVQGDLRDVAAPAAIVEAAMARFGRLDVLVSSASQWSPMPLHDVTPEAWADIEAVNLRAPFFLMQAAARVMPEGGVIVQVGDHLGAETGFPALIPHSVTKAALLPLVRMMAEALAPRIRVNAVVPGLVLEPEDFPEAARARFLRDVPLGRAGTPEDVAEAIRYLVDAPYVTGTVLEVDGGRHLRR